MPYADIIDLQAAADPEWLIHAADTAGTGQPDTDLLDAALAAAAAEIDAHLAARYRLPLATPAPDLLREANAVLAIERLALRLPAAPLPDDTRERVRQLRAILRDIAAGRLALPGATSAPRAATRTAGVGKLEAF